MGEIEREGEGDRGRANSGGRERGSEGEREGERERERAHFSRRINVFMIIKPLYCCACEEQ